MKSTTKQEKHCRLKLFLFHRGAALIALILACAIIFTGCDNNAVPVGTETTQPSNNHMPSVDKTLNVGYSEEDSLNPFFMTTDINSDIVSLVFEPLFYLDDTFMARNKSKQLDAKLAKSTKWIGLVFVVLTLVLTIIH